MPIRNPLILLAVITEVVVTGCTGFNSFSDAALPGETISVTLGWHQKLTRDQLTVTITPSSGAPVVYLPGDPAVRALVNLYPDPLSRLIIERETGTSLDDGYLFSLFMEGAVTGADKDFFQTILLMDLPTGIIDGPATIAFSSTGGETLLSQSVQVLPGGPVPRHEFQVQEGLTPQLGEQLDLGERVPHYVVSFSGGSTVPHAIQVDLIHDDDQSLGGIGNPYVVSPRGADIKSAVWSDDGRNMRVILMPTGYPIADLVNFKFYVAGGLSNLQLADPLLAVSAYDINGDIVPGISATVDPQF